MNRVFLIKRNVPGGVNYDEFDGHVVIAKTPKRVREIISTTKSDFGFAYVGNELVEVWLSNEDSPITVLGYSNLPEQVVLSSFNAG